MFIFWIPEQESLRHSLIHQCVRGLRLIYVPVPTLGENPYIDNPMDEYGTWLVCNGQLKRSAML